MINMKNDPEIFGGKKFSDILEEIHKNSNDKKYIYNLSHKVRLFRPDMGVKMILSAIAIAYIDSTNFFQTLQLYRPLKSR